MRWNIDATHSAVEFGVKHLGISTTKGRFQKFSGAIEADAAGVPAGLDVTIDVGSIDTNMPDRDAHLRSADFFDAGAHPAMTYRSSSVRPVTNGYEVLGDLTMKGISHPVTFHVEAETPITDPWGNQRIAGHATGKLSRKEWGLTWNKVMEAGGFVVGDEVKFNLDIELVAERAAAAA